MERPPKPSVAVAALVLLVHVMAAAEPAIAMKLEPAGTSSHIPPLLDCAPAPAAGSTNLSAFRGNVLALLDALPPAVAAAAAAPTGGFAAAQSGGVDRAFERAFCYGSGSSASDDCVDCLSAAAQDVTDGCHGRRGAVWRAGCFLWYADTNASTAHEDAWRGWFYDDSEDYEDDDHTPTSGQCMANRTAAECSRCLNESAQVVPALSERRQLLSVHGDAVVVVGYSCYLRVPLRVPAMGWLDWVVFGLFIFDGVVLGLEVAGVLVVIIVGLVCCIRIAIAAACG